ncbi:hypothetical protein LAZ67_X001428 [Cordylochernes scorpioides]|uniref:Histone-lysine N-methyltransferase SETMAR n=1 Tax=Cordylochernes scorpioides TaxID=51811 RepID=A0ABY6LSF5_9ARAC|nr:hypothetical protein LAZ67_X001428 [Cordylochernes scorpioides]
MMNKDNKARPHASVPFKTHLETLKWEVLPHPPYSPDIAPSDYYLFRSMKHNLADQHFFNYEEIILAVAVAASAVPWGGHGGWGGYGGYGGWGGYGGGWGGYPVGRAVAYGSSIKHAGGWGGYGGLGYGGWGGAGWGRGYGGWGRGYGGWGGHGWH